MAKGPFFPAAYADLHLSTADLLRLAFAAVVAAGAVYELYRVSTERARHLAVERGNSERLKELQIMKADFTAMVAHELASPLLAVRGYAEIVGTGEAESQGVPDDPSSLETDDYESHERIRALRSLREQTDRLAALISDVRASAEVEREDFSVEKRRTPVKELLDEAADFAGTIGSDHPIVVRDSSDGAEVWADPERVGQVLRNLLANAVKCSPAGSPVMLTAGLSDNAERLRISVSDRGCGIPEDETSRIFEKFVRGRTPERPESGSGGGSADGSPASTSAFGKGPGAGLGLYICRGIVKGHGGQLTVSSTPEVGSTFSFELGLAAPPLISPASTPDYSKAQDSPPSTSRSGSTPHSSGASGEDDVREHPGERGAGAHNASGQRGRDS